MRLEMEIRNYSQRTIKAYISGVAEFAKHFGKSPDTLGLTEVKTYMHYLLRVKQSSYSKVKVVYSALKFFYTQVLGRNWQAEHLPRLRKSKRLPTVLSRVEVKLILSCVSNLKHRVFLMTTYSAGLRISETANLKVTDIDSQRKQIRVEQGKGNKDRYTLLSETLLQHLRLYWQIHHPRSFLFPGQTADKAIDPSVIQRAFKTAKKKPVLRSLPVSTP
jgi:site-specific recombinase XerD